MERQEELGQTPLTVPTRDQIVWLSVSTVTVTDIQDKSTHTEEMLVLAHSFICPRPWSLGFIALGL